MVNEVFSYKVQRLADEVFQRFGDIGAVQIDNEMILRWTNDGIRSVMQQNPFLKKVASTNLIAGQAVYPFGTAFPSAKIISFEQIVVNGRPVQTIPFTEFQTLLAQPTGTEAPTGMPGVATSYGDALTLWPTPSETVANGLTMYFSAYPDDVAEMTDDLPIPDRFYNPLRDYVFAQALELDHEFDAAKAKMQQHDMSLQREYERENRSPTAIYPTPLDVEGGYYFDDDVEWV